MATTDDPMPLPPQKPAPAECCEAGCERCVFDLYAEALQSYQRELAAWRARQTGPSQLQR